MADSNPTIWTPSTNELQNSALAKFRDLVNKQYQLSLNTYDEIHAWSVDPDTAGDFWMALFEFLDMGAMEAPSRAFEKVSSLTPSNMECASPLHRSRRLGRCSPTQHSSQMPK